jgi:deoxyribodipyrimidine photo-lyase
MHSFPGGETYAKIRLNHLLSSGFITTYYSTYDKLLDIDCSSKLSAYLALGCITSQQIHASLVAFKDGVSNPETEKWKGAPRFGGGENKGTTRMRLRLL